jgi:hypothetical protein
MDGILKSYLNCINEVKEELVTAFIAKHGFDPDHAEIIQETEENCIKIYIRKRNNGKVCRISSLTNSWVLEVEGKTEYFAGYGLAGYLKNIHEELGYKVIYEPLKFMEV